MGQGDNVGPIPKGSQSPGSSMGGRQPHGVTRREIRGDAKQQYGMGELSAGFALPVLSAKNNIT